MASPQMEAEQKEAYQYWGYLFKQDRTGTDMLKNLLRGIHQTIITTFEPSESPDITPSQMALFYKAVNGNYDPLFLSTPPSTIAFIYKNLGCLHSLQPPANLGDRYADPVVPALKVEGWIMWQTVQLLLGPDEQWEFLRQAVQKWNVKNPDTGEPFTKILPRSCFPPHPDTSMVEWYEGMSSRLRREAEEQERIRVQPIEDRPDTPNNSKHHRKISRYSDSALTDDESPPDHKNFAIAYFRDPLFRAIDGRPGLVRNSSRRRPPLSPRDSFVHRSKTVASTFGNVIKNVGSPHLWDGHAVTKDKDKDKDRDHRRRKSLPDKHHYQDLDDDDERLRPYSRRSSVQDSPPEHPSHHSHHHGSSSLRPSPTYHDPNSRHRRSHGPTSPREYFPPVDDEMDMRRSSSATHLKPRSTSPQKSGFMPSVSPLFATHVAREGFVPSARSRQSSARSPERPEVSRHSGDGGSGSEVGSSRGGSRSNRPKVARFQDTPVGGVSGRKYPVESAYR